MTLATDYKPDRKANLNHPEKKTLDAVTEPHIKAAFSDHLKTYRFHDNVILEARQSIKHAISLQLTYGLEPPILPENRLLTAGEIQAILPKLERMVATETLRILTKYLGACVMIEYRTRIVDQLVESVPQALVLDESVHPDILRAFHHRTSA